MAGSAIFDLDRTLTRHPTWLRFLHHANRNRPAFVMQVPLLGVFALAHKLGRMDRSAIKTRFMSTLGWAGREAIEQAGRDFAEVEIGRGLRAGARNLIERHRAAGHRLVLATAASDFIAEPIGNGLGLDDVICTRTSWPDGPAGAPCVDGINCDGAEKYRRVMAAISAGSLPRPLHIYSDHVSDLDLLRLADHGVATNPSPELRRQAHRHGLAILDLDTGEEKSVGGAFRHEELS